MIHLYLCLFITNFETSSLRAQNLESESRRIEDDLESAYRVTRALVNDSGETDQPAVADDAAIAQLDALAEQREQLTKKVEDVIQNCMPQKVWIEC